MTHVDKRLIVGDFAVKFAGSDLERRFEEDKKKKGTMTMTHRV